MLNFPVIKSISQIKTFVPPQKTISFKGGYDTFEKSSTLSINSSDEVKAASTSKVWDKNRTQKLYDDVYKDVMRLIPLTNELRIEKPKTVFEEKSDGTAPFCYSITSNTVKIRMPEISQDLYLCTAKDKNGDEIGSFGIHKEEDLSELTEEFKNKYSNIETVETKKLTDTEKELYLKCLMAHELRHCVQIHLMASTKDCSKPFKAAALRNFERFKSADDDYSTIEYIDNYVPKKLIPEDKKLKFSICPDDKRYLSTKGHILDYTLRFIANPFNKTLYNASPTEADANNFALEYFILSENKPEYSSLRGEMSDEILNIFYEQADNGLKAMKQQGFPGLFAKIR